MRGNLEDLSNALDKLSEAAREASISMEMFIQRQNKLTSPKHEYMLKTKFGKGDRRKNKKQFMNQINRKL